MSAPLTAAAAACCCSRSTAHRDEPGRRARWLHGASCDRLDEPLRVAIAGKVKAGKSTLLNALVGEQVAPTDAGECTRVVTWYRDGHGAADRAAPARRRRRRPLPVRRRDGALVIDLRRHARPSELDRLVVDWPSQSLRADHADRHPGHRVD